VLINISQSSTPSARRATRTLLSSCNSYATTWYVCVAFVCLQHGLINLQTLWTSSEAEPAGEAAASREEPAEAPASTEEPTAAQ